MMNEIKEKEPKIRSYVEKCFRDAYAAEERTYDGMWKFEYLCIKNYNGEWQLIPIVCWCKYARIIRRVIHRLENNMKKNFGLIYGRTDDLRYLFYDDGQIDYNFTEAMFRITSDGDMHDQLVTLSVFDEESDNRPDGECVAYRFEKLLFAKWDINADIYEHLSYDDERRSLPSRMSWKQYWELYNKAFGCDPGSKLEIVCSSGVERLFGGE